MTNPRRTPAAHQRGLTLIELLVGTMIAAFLTAAAFAFAAHESRLMGVSRERVELSQAGRAAIDLIAADLAEAGAGLGYGIANGNMNEPNAARPCPGGNVCFRGLLVGNFTVRGVAFNTAGTTPVLGVPVDIDNLALNEVGVGGAIGPGYVAPTQAIGMRMANGSYASIVNFEGGQPEFCVDDPALGVPTNFRDGELVVLRHQDGILARSALIDMSASGACVANAAACANGCRTFDTILDLDRTFVSYDGAFGASYRGGELQGGLKTVVWYIAPNAATRSGTLNRAVFDSNTCPGPVANLAACAGAVSEFAETLFTRVWVWDTTAIPAAWRHVGVAPVVTPSRIRVDVELVMRSRVPDAKPNTPVQLQIPDGPLCIPGACGGTDNGDRRVYRTTIEVANSGRMALPR